MDKVLFFVFFNRLYFFKIVLSVKLKRAEDKRDVIKIYYPLISLAVVLWQHKDTPLLNFD